MTEQSTDDTDRPGGWPELFLNPAPSCSHAYHWDDADGLYRCLDCGDIRKEPKDSEVETSDQSNTESDP